MDIIQVSYDAPKCEICQSMQTHSKKKKTIRAEGAALSASAQNVGFYVLIQK